MEENNCSYDYKTNSRFKVWLCHFSGGLSTLYKMRYDVRCLDQCLSQGSHENVRRANGVHCEQ